MHVDNHRLNREESSNMKDMTVDSIVKKVDVSKLTASRRLGILLLQYQSPDHKGRGVSAGKWLTQNAIAGEDMQVRQRQMSQIGAVGRAMKTTF